MMIRVIFTALIVLMIAASTADCEGFKYESRGRRDPFVPLIGQDKAQAAGLVDVTSFEDIKLEGIALREEGRTTAIINGEIVKQGDKIGEVEIKTITGKDVILTINGKSYKASLPEEGGLKSEQ